MKKTTFTAFQKWLKETDNVIVNEVRAKWPYNYNDNKAYEVTYNKVTQYFFFNDDGVLLQRKLLQDNR